MNGALKFQPNSEHEFLAGSERGRDESVLSECFAERASNHVARVEENSAACARAMVKRSIVYRNSTLAKDEKSTRCHFSVLHPKLCISTRETKQKLCQWRFEMAIINSKYSVASERDYKARRIFRSKFMRIFTHMFLHLKKIKRENTTINNTIFAREYRADILFSRSFKHLWSV